jgi:hypothetical protein
MELVFTKDIPRSGGDQWSAGQIADYPRATWDAIAGSIGKALDTFTRTVADAAEAGVKKQNKSKKQ